MDVVLSMYKINNQSCSTILWIHSQTPYKYGLYTKECFIKILFLSLSSGIMSFNLGSTITWMRESKFEHFVKFKFFLFGFFIITLCDFVVVLKLTLRFKKSQAVVVFVLLPPQCPFGISNGSERLDVLRQFGRSSLFWRLRLIISSSFWML